MVQIILHLILIQCLALLLASQSFASNEFSQPMIFSGPGPQEGYCKIIRVHSLNELQGQLYSQHGVGWFIAGQEGYKVLVPSHVVSGADIVLGDCLGTLFPLRLQSRSETLDLALLTPMADVNSFASPFIYLQKREQALQALKSSQHSIESLHPDHFKFTMDKIIRNQTGNSYLVPTDERSRPLKEVKTYESDLGKIGIAHFQKGLNSLVAETLAIQPGYSGAPLFAHLAKQNFNYNDFLYNVLARGDFTSKYLLGMLTRTEINGSRSLGISLPMILIVLPTLWNSQNPHEDAYVRSHKHKWKLRYKNELTGNVLERFQELVYEDASRPPMTYTEVCADDTLESSEWQTPKNADLDLKTLVKKYKSLASEEIKNRQLQHIIETYQKSSGDFRSIHQRSGGGDYGEGGGSKLATKHSHLMVPDLADLTLRTRGGSTLTSYRRDKLCEKVVIKDHHSRTYDSIVFQGKTKRATSLVEAYDLLSAGGRWGSSSDRHLCENYYLTKDSSTDTMTTFYKSDGQLYFHHRMEGIAVPAGQQNLSENHQGQISCSNNEIQIQLKEKDLDLMLQLPKNRPPAGYIRFSNSKCSIPVTSKNHLTSNQWKHLIRDPKADLDISLNSEGRILSIKVLRLSPTCTPNSHEFLWLGEMHYLDSKSMDEKSIYWKDRTIFQGDFR